MPSEALRSYLKAGYNKFFILPVEEMYRHVYRQVPASRATSHTLIYLTEGEAYMKIGSELFRIYKNEILFVPAGQIFSFEAYDTGKFNKGFICNFHDDLLISNYFKSELLKKFEFLQVWGNHYVSLKEETSGFVLQLLQRIFLDYSRFGLQHLDLLQSNFIALLFEINQVYEPLFLTKQTAAVNLTNKFKEALFKNIKIKRLVTDYSTLLHVSPNHLNKVIKNVTSKSPTKWIDEVTILEAKVLLYQTDMSIAQVALSVGIEDQSYFSRIFKRQEGISPTEFRALIDKS